MADSADRTAEEREAARRERERRRGVESGQVPIPGPQAEAAAPQVEPVATPDLPAAPEFTPTDGNGEHETGEHETELASGTRRVSHGENIAGRRDRQIPARPPGKRTPRATRATRATRSTRAARATRAARRPRPNSERRGGHSWLGRAVVLGFLTLAVALIWFAVELFQPLSSSPHGHVRVIVPTKSTSSQIGDLLARNGVISSSFFFEVRATLAGERSSMRAGVYNLQKGMSYGAVLSKLTTAPPAAKVSSLTIAEGRRRAQISALLREQHLGSNYLAATRTTKLLNMRAYGLRHAPPNLEGFLFPSTYQLIDPIKVSALVTDQLHTFKQEFGTLDLRSAERKHLTPYDVLKIASLVEAETPTVHDRPLVASVIYNRLADGMLLGLDSTTQYATGNFTKPLTVSQLHSNSPYNTRTHPGLPPTPIDNPGLASLQAAAHPGQTHYLYFFATPCRRNSVFASSYQQFLSLGRQYAAKHC